MQIIRLQLLLPSHGYLNNKGMQDSNSLELSRRGAVVIAVDQPGCGESDTADYAGQNGYGFWFIAVYQAALELSRLPYVDSTRIGVTGHSMGGISSNWAVMADNASENPIISAVLLNCADPVFADGAYDIVNVGTNGEFTNIYGSRDVGMIACVYDEFFHKTVAADGTVLDSPHFMENNPNVQSFLHFGKDPSGLDERVEETIYRENIDGKESIRTVYRPVQIHPWSHFSKKSEIATIEFFEESLDLPKDIASTSQVWQLKEAMNLIGLIGFVFFIISFASLMVFTQTFEELRAKESVVAMKTDKKGIVMFWISAAASTLFGVLTYHPVVSAAGAWPIAEQTMIFGIAFWAMLCGGVSIAFIYLSYRLFDKSAGINLADRGVSMPIRKLGKTIVLATLVIAVSYAWVFLADFLFLADFRIWNIGVKVFNANILRISLFPHALFFMVFYIAFSVSNNSFNFNQIGGKHSWANNLVLTVTALLPLIILLIAQYGTYFATGSLGLTREGEPMNVAQLWAFLMIIPGAAVIDRMLYKVTKNPYLAGIITGVIVAIISSANTTTHLI